MLRAIKVRTRRLAARPVAISLLLALAAGLVWGLWPAQPAVSTTIALGQPLGSNAMVVDAHTHRAFIATMMMSPAAPPTSRINVLDTRTGALLPPVIVGVNLLPLALDDRSDHVVVATSTLANSGLVRLLDGTTGAIVRSVALSQVPTALAVDSRTERIFVVGGSNGVCTTAACRANPALLSVLDARTLRVLRAATLSQTLGAIAVDERRGRVFVPTIGGLLVLDAADGRVRATLPAEYVLAVDEQTGHIVVGTNDGLGMVDLRGGRFLWFRREVAASTMVDARTGNVLLIPVASNAVEVVNGASGRLMRTIRVGGLPVSMTIDARIGRAFVANHDDHTVSVLDVRSWRVLQTVPVGPYPTTVLVDASAHRAIVENTSAYVSRSDMWGWAPPQVRRWLPFLPLLPSRVIPAVPTSSSVTMLDTSHL